MPHLPPALVDIVSSSLADMFASVGALADVREEGRDADLGATVATEAASVLGFTGDAISGSLVLALDVKLLEASHPNLEMGMPVGPADVSDWAGEMANQILGRIKNKLAVCGVKFAMATPTTVMGKAMQVKLPKDGAALAVRCKGKAGGLTAYFVAVCAPGLDLAKAAGEDAAREGDGLFF